MTNPIPARFHMLTSLILVTDGPAAIKFYNEGFGAQENSQLMSPNGKKDTSVMAPCFFQE